MTVSCDVLICRGYSYAIHHQAAYAHFAHELNCFDDFIWRDCCDNVLHHCCDGLWCADAHCCRSGNSQPRKFAQTSRCSFLSHLFHDSLYLRLWPGIQLWSFNGFQRFSEGW